jgi:hypothetical protein
LLPGLVADAAVSVGVDAFAVLLVLHPLAFELVSVGELQLPLARALVLGPLAHVSAGGDQKLEELRWAERKGIGYLSALWKVWTPKPSLSPDFHSPW